MGTGLWQDIGPVAGIYNGVALPDTYGGARLRISTETRESYKDKTGTLPRDRTNVGTLIELEMTFTAVTLAQLQKLIPGATLFDSSTKMSVASVVGLSERDNAQVLILKPIVGSAPTSDQDQWIRFDLAYPSPNIEVTFTNEDQKVFVVMFHIFDDEATGILMQFGVSS